MKLYSGNGGHVEGIPEIQARDMGILISAASWRTPKPNIPWALDNGAFTLGAPVPFDLRRFERVLRKVPSDHRPDFGVIPDIVAGGLSSLVFSLSCLRWLPHGWPWYLAVQDGMEEADISPHANEIEGIFVGGSPKWKEKAAEAWIGFAHARGMKSHIGRVGTVERLVWARRIGADSVDSISWARHGTWNKPDEAASQTILEAVESQS